MKKIFKNKINKQKNTIFILIAIIVTIVSIIGFILHNVYNNVELNWDESYPDYKLEYVLPNKIKLGIKLEDEDKINKVKYTVTCGEYTVDGTEIIWDLKEAKGDCEIIVAFRNKKITKKYNVLPFKIDNENMNFDLVEAN